MLEEARWYVVHTYSGYENKVATDIQKTVENRKLQEFFQEVRIPMETVTEFDKDGAKKEVERKLFPGYVLVKMVMTDTTWYVVRNTRGVTGFVGPGSKPVPLTEEEVAKLGVDHSHIEVNFAVGDSVQVHRGYMAGYIGIVDDIDLQNETVRLTVSMMGRDTPMELPLDQVEPLNN